MKKVVFTPGVVAATLTNRIGLELFHLWRDGVIQPVVERTLLERYIRAMSLLNLSPRLIRRWAWWFTSLEKVVYLSADPFPPEMGTAELCARVAEMGSAEWVIHHERSAGVGPTFARWVSAQDYLQSHGEFEDPKKG